MSKVTGIIDKILTNFLIVLMAVMVLTVTWQVFTRFILRSPSSYTEELATFLLIWIGILGASHALKTRAHLGIDIITEKLQGVKKKTVEIVAYAFVILFAFFVMIVGGIRLVQLTLTLNQISPALEIKMGYVYTVVPVSGFIIIIYSIEFMMKISGGETISYTISDRPVD